jgi:hypothetical protein
MQIRDAASNLVHGIVYGRTTTSSCGAATSLVSNSSSPLVATTNGGNTFYAYNGLDLDGYFDATKWTTGSASSATPGAFNSLNNQIWILDTIRKGCVCSVTLNQTFDDKIKPERESGFNYKQQGEYLIFNSDVNTNLILRLFSTDGRFIAATQTRFRGFYSYRFPKGIFYLNVFVEYRYSQNYSTIKIINL